MTRALERLFLRIVHLLPQQTEVWGDVARPPSIVNSSDATSSHCIQLIFVLLVQSLQLQVGAQDWQDLFQQTPFLVGLCATRCYKVSFQIPSVNYSSLQCGKQTFCLGEKWLQQILQRQRTDKLLEILFSRGRCCSIQPFCSCLIAVPLWDNGGQIGNFLRLGEPTHNS